MISSDDHFVQKYINNVGESAPKAPTLSDSLRAFAGMPSLSQIMRGLPRDCSCLIQGYTAPGNAEALRAFLKSMNVPNAEVAAVDLLDLPAIYARLGQTLPEMDFIQADACNLADQFGDDRFDVLVQDFILNCAPSLQAGDLLAAARRVLKTTGLAFISFTDSSGLSDVPCLSRAELKSRCQIDWDSAARDLFALIPSEEIRGQVYNSLAGRLIAGSETGQRTCITKPHGRFEFFVPLNQTLRQLAEAGFDLVAMTSQTGMDDNGLRCARHRCLARVARPD